MRKLFLTALFTLFSVGVFSQGADFYNRGKADLKNKVEKVRMNFEYDLPLVEVNINDKIFRFVFDTGAPTIISSEIYKLINAKVKFESHISDSQNVQQKQIFTEIPEMKVDGITFKKIGAVVVDFKGSEFGCLKIDGILGANQMSKLFWRINYSENLLEATKDLSNFKLDSYETVFSFKTMPQKTPKIKTRILDEILDLTFDTGSIGALDISHFNYDSKNNKEHIEIYGITSVGAFGVNKPETAYYFKPEKVLIGKSEFKNEIVLTDASSTLGNKFLKKFSFVMDWKNSKIYLHKIKDTPSQLDSFGFGYRFINDKAKVVLLFSDQDVPLKFNDEILSINEVSFENLNPDMVCSYLMHRIEEGVDAIDIKVKRDEKILNFSLKKKVYL